METIVILNLVEKYFKRENVKFRNIVDSLQTILIEELVYVKTLKEICNNLRIGCDMEHSLYKDLDRFIVNEELPRQDFVDAINLAIFYFNNKKHTEVLRHLYETILN